MPGDESTQKQRDYINDLLSDPFTRARATLHLGTIPDASSMSKREASALIDGIKYNHPDEFTWMSGKPAATRHKLMEDLDIIDDIQSHKRNTQYLGPAGFVYRTKDKSIADEMNAFSRKYSLGIGYEVGKPIRPPRAGSRAS